MFCKLLFRMFDAVGLGLHKLKSLQANAITNHKTISCTLSTLPTLHILLETEPPPFWSSSWRDETVTFSSVSHHGVVWTMSMHWYHFMQTWLMCSLSFQFTTPHWRNGETIGGHVREWGAWGMEIQTVGLKWFLVSNIDSFLQLLQFLNRVDGVRVTLKVKLHIPT